MLYFLHNGDREESITQRHAARLPFLSLGFQIVASGDSSSLEQGLNTANEGVHGSSFIDD